ncbi:hypothetical protein LXL04_009889 [Taraxacum kok-saghyz]
MDHQWVKNGNRASVEYVDGVKEFLNVARNTLDANGLTLCPCVNCLNSRVQTISVITAHVISVGIDKSYTRWVYHGEAEVEEEDVRHGDSINEEYVGLRAGLDDATGHPFFDIGPTDDLIGNQHPESARYEKLYEALKKPLYEGCKTSTLTFVVKFMNLKVMNKWTDNSFEMMLKVLRDDLPEGNNCPESYYDVRMLLCEAGLGYELIDVCQYDCAIFYGHNKDAITCPVCHNSRYVRNKIAHKKLRYFPITPRLKRLYASRHTAKDMHGKAWKHFDDLYPTFANDPRSVRLGLASDGFNPFSNMSTSYSMWPVILMPYNMPPCCTMHKSNYLLTLLIPGPKSPGKDFDVFLRPLVDELNVLWGDGVQAYDAHSKSLFTLRAAVIWTISDFPAYAYLSGWSTMGKLACPICLEDTRSNRIHGKQCYAGHRCFLSKTHRWRKSKEFDGKQEKRDRPRLFTGDQILRQLATIPRCTTGKAPSNEDRKHKRGVDELNWSKKSILFELPYWSKLLMRHNLDIMHIEKNVCDNIIGTLLNDPVKSKDTPKARLDLEDLNIRKDQWLRERNGKFEKPHANFTLSKDECVEFCKFIKSVRLPDGYACNISRCVTDSNTLGGMKTHDCHVLLQKILPVAILPFLNKEIRTALIEFCQFFQKICSKTLDAKELENMKTGIVIILCKLEKIFPPTFFTVMVHLCVHLPEEALLGGPVSQRWMFGIERRMGTYKGYVRNFARPDGSITEAYVVDEAVTFLSRYVDDIETRFNRLERNWDAPTTKHELEVFNNKVRKLGSSKFRQLGEDVDVVQWYIINNCGDEVDVYLEANGDAKATNDLYALSQFPDDRYTSWQSCIVHGVRFRCKERDENFKTQCSGVCVGDENEELVYYGVLLEVLELDFILGRKVFVFRCNWYNTDPKGKKMVVDHNLTSIDITSKWYVEEPFILASQAQQVFYLNDLARGKNWMVVQKVNHRNIYDILEHDEDEVLINDVFQEAESSELPPFQPTEELPNTSLIVRNDVEPETLPLETVLAIRNRNVVPDNLDDDDEFDDDDGRIFLDNEPILDSDTEDDSDDPNPNSDDDDFSKTIMTRRGGRGKRGGQTREDGRRTTTIPDPIPPTSNQTDSSSPVPPTSNQINSSSPLSDTIFDTEQESGTGAKRGITCGKGARKAMKASKKRLQVEFNFDARRVICDNKSSFTHECGYIVRKNCSLQYKEWRLVPMEVRLPLRYKLTTLFDIDVENKNIAKVIDSYMARSWRNYRAELHNYFKEIKGLEDPIKAKTTPPSNICNKEDWEYLCEMWCKPKYLEVAEKKVIARGKRKMESRNGSKSTIRYHIELGHAVDSSCGHIETWRHTRWDEENGWKSQEMAAKYEEMKKLRNEHSLESMSDKLIMEKVLGRSSVRLFGWGRDPVVAGNTASSSNNSKRPTYDELVDELGILKEKNATMEQKYATMEQLLIEKNIMTPPVSTSSGRSHNGTFDCGASNHTQSGQSREDFSDDIVDTYE